MVYLFSGLVSDEEEQPLIVKMPKRKTTAREILASGESPGRPNPLKGKRERKAELQTALYSIAFSV
jgi:hypothetical protein